MNQSKERECPINPNCKRLKADGSCDFSCMEGIANSAREADKRDGYTRIENSASKMNGDLSGLH